MSFPDEALRMATDDQILLERWTGQRDAEAFKAICDRYAPMVYATCRRVLRTQTESEDVTQDCFEALATTTSPPRGHLGPWLHRVATYRALNRARGEKRRKERERAYASQQADSLTLDWDDVHDLVDEAIEKLPDRARVAIVGHFIEGKTHAAIALELGVSRVAVTQSTHRGIEGIRKYLKRRGLPIASSGLTVILRAHLAEAAAVPATLQSALGRVALSGIGTPGSIATIGGMAMTLKTTLKAACIGAFMLVVLSAGLFSILVNDSEELPAAVTSREPEDNNDAVASVVEAEGITPPIVEAVPNTHLEDTPQENQAFIKGIVTDSAHRPIPGAFVFTGIRRFPPDSKEAIARTENNGAFSLSTVPDGTGMLTGWHPDYAPGWTRLPKELASSENVVIKLNEGGRIVGHAYFGGKPVDGQAISVKYMGDVPSLSFSANTDTLGRYEVTNLPPGAPRVYLYPKWGGNEINKLAVVEVGKVTVIDFELGALGVPLAGKALLDESPLADTHVYISVIAEDGSIEEFHTKTDEDGRYSFEWLPLGHGILKVRASDGGDGWQNYVRTFELTSAEDNVIDVVVSTEGGTLAAHVPIPENHRAFYAAVLHGEHELTEFNIEMLYSVSTYKVAEPRIDADGNLLIERLEPGVYTVCVAVADAGFQRQSEADIMHNSLLATDIVEVGVQEVTKIDLRLP